MRPIRTPSSCDVNEPEYCLEWISPLRVFRTTAQVDTANLVVLHCVDLAHAVCKRSSLGFRKKKKSVSGHMQQPSKPESNVRVADTADFSGGKES